MTRFTSPRRLLAALVACGALAVHGPTPIDAQSPTFKSSVAMVPLTVTVTDTTGKHVTGLTGNDFTVFEDGVEQPLSFFACDEVPVDVALVVDTSGSMRGRSAAGPVGGHRPGQQTPHVRSRRGR